MFSLSGFNVPRCTQNFRLSDSPLLIRFSDATSFDELSEPVSPLPEECFRFRNQTELVGLANTNTQLPDIISPRQRVQCVILLERRIVSCDITVTLRFFDSQALSFHKKLEDMHNYPKVIVATSINPKMVGGGLFLNAI